MGRSHQEGFSFRVFVREVLETKSLGYAHFIPLLAALIPNNSILSLPFFVLFSVQQALGAVSNSLMRVGITI